MFYSTCCCIYSRVMKNSAISNPCAPIASLICRCMRYASYCTLLTIFSWRILAHWHYSRVFAGVYVQHHPWTWHIVHFHASCIIIFVGSYLSKHVLSFCNWVRNCISWRFIHEKLLTSSELVTKLFLGALGIICEAIWVNYFFAIKIVCESPIFLFFASFLSIIFALSSVLQSWLTVFSGLLLLLVFALASH